MVAVVPVAVVAAESFSRYLESAERGDRAAQAYVGYLYYTGQEGAPIDPTVAAQWFHSAAEAGSMDAQYNLALLLEHGSGVAVDLPQALAWYQRAAAQGQVQAQYNAALMYMQGRGTAPDVQAALALLRTSATAGHVPAQFRLALFYQQGEQGEPDLQQAIHWYRRAALQGDPQAQYNLALLQHSETDYWLRQAAAQDYAPAVEALAKLPSTTAPAPEDADLQTLIQVHRWLHMGDSSVDPLALKALESLAVHGVAEAQLLLGALYYQGRAVARDRHLSRHWIKRAAQGAHLPALYLYAHLLYTGAGGDQPAVEQAAVWYERAAARGLEEARAILAHWETLDTEALREELLVRTGLLLGNTEALEVAAQTRHAYWRAYSTLPESADQAGPAPTTGESPQFTLPSPTLAEARVQYETGMNFALGAGVTQAPAVALQWFLRSARQGYPPAQYKAGMAYLHGIGTVPKAKQARRWLEAAALQNYAVAQRELAGMLIESNHKQERIHAYAWYSLAARTGRRQDLQSLARLRRELTREEVRIGRRLAARLAESMSSERTQPRHDPKAAAPTSVHTRRVSEATAP